MCPDQRVPSALNIGAILKKREVWKGKLIGKTGGARLLRVQRTVLGPSVWDL